MHAREAAAHDIAAAAQALETELGRYVTEADNNARLARAYEMEILPRAQKTLEIRQDAWISSKISLLEVLDARRALLEARLDFKRALAAHHSALARIRNLTGDGLPR
jgi:cobalt-zinc-cadmium efflux system outer membrane protein